jgi:serine acetyltransferase
MIVRKIKDAVLAFWMVERFIRLHIRVARAFYFKGGLLGRITCYLFDRFLLILYGIDLHSPSIDVASLSIAHPDSVMLGGNGIVSTGRLAIMAGVKFVGRSPRDPDYLRLHREGRVFSFGDNVVIGANSVVVGPIDICNDVVIAAMSLVNRSITEPGVYAGIPAIRIKTEVTDEWVAHLPTPSRSDPIWPG